MDFFNAQKFLKCRPFLIALHRPRTSKKLIFLSRKIQNFLSNLQPPLNFAEFGAPGSSVGPRAYLRGGGGGGSGGSNPPPKFSDFFLKSEGKEVERKRKKNEKGWEEGG